MSYYNDNCRRCKNHGDAMEWVNIKDKLPEDGKYVLLHGKCYDYIIGIYSTEHKRFEEWGGDDFDSMGFVECHGVTHWHTLPLLPEGI